MNPVNSVIAAKTGIYAVDTLMRIDGFADAIDRKTARIWQQILRLLSADPMPVDFRPRLAELLTQVQNVCAHGVRDALRDTVHRARTRTAWMLASSLPIEYLTLAIAGKRTNPYGRVRVTEGRRATAAERAQIEAQLLPVESQEEIDRIVYAPSGRTTWQQRMAMLTGLAHPETVAQVIALARAQGETAGQMAQRLLPIVQNNRVSARRIARTESARCSTEASMQTYENMGELIIGYQINAHMDWRTRPHHAARNGTIYYRQPTAGQLSMLHMPRPPIEEDGTVAHNCRCYLSPVLTPAEHVESDPSLKALFTDQRHDIIPDPQTYENWFAQATEQERRWAVGARRLRAATQRLEPGEPLRWATMISPTTGQLLPAETIRHETPRRREERIAVVNNVIAERTALHRQISRFGYLAGPETFRPTMPAIPREPGPMTYRPVRLATQQRPTAATSVPKPPATKPRPQTPELPIPKATKAKPTKATTTPTNFDISTIARFETPGGVIQPKAQPMEPEQPKTPKKPGKDQRKLKPIKRPAKRKKTAREIKKSKGRRS